MASIRIAAEIDASALADIYAPAVTDSAVSFETEAPDTDEMTRRIRNNLIRFPWLVCELDQRVAGYTYATRHRERAAYQWSVEVSAYVHPQAQRSGVARGLYTSVLAVLTLQGFRNAYAGITLPNEASVGLHEALGFQPVGIYRHVGFKLGAWHDVGWWQKELGRADDPPSPPIDFVHIRGTAECEEAIAAGEPLLRLHPRA